MITQENTQYTADEVKAMVKTIEELRKKYNEALSRAKHALDCDRNNFVNTDVPLIYSMFPELKESKDERIRKELIAHCRNTRCVTEEGAEQVKNWIAWLEKQSEQKPFDKSEPKFKVGDWIVSNNNGEVWQIGARYTNEGQQLYLYNVNDVIMPVTLEELNNDYHLWTIQDAKDGDVLINWNNTTFIFKAIEDETVKFHMAYNEKWDTIKTPSTKLSHLGLPEPQFEFHPATEEQRDLLFQKMKEAGYKWDSEKKELKKIEVASKESEDRIRKALKQGFSEYGNSFTTFGGIKVEDILAWFEK